MMEIDSHILGLVLGAGVGGLILGTFLWFAIYFGFIRKDKDSIDRFDRVLLISNYVLMAIVGFLVLNTR